MNKTCSLELSRKLFEAGLKIGTEKWWIDRQDALGFEICRFDDFEYYTKSAIKFPNKKQSCIYEMYIGKRNNEA